MPILSRTCPPASLRVFLISDRKGFPKNFFNSSRRSSRKGIAGIPGQEDDISQRTGHDMEG
jgi:hypothetical protein